MPQKLLKFTGINRRSNEFQNIGACEELINIRPSINGEHRVAKPKYRHERSISYDYIYRHSFGNIDNEIVVTNGDVLYMKDLGAPFGVTSAFKGKSGIEISSAGNVLLIYCSETKTQLAFKFVDDVYKPFSLNLIEIENAYVHLSATKNNGYTATSYVETDDLSDSGIKQALADAETNFYQDFNNGLCGVSIVGCTYELEDGSEFWSTAFAVADARQEPKYITDTGKLNVSGVSITGSPTATLHLSFTMPEDCSVKKINVYATKPISGLSISHEGGSIEPLSKYSLDGQLMYYQGSIVGEERSLVLNFSSAQTGEAIMDVTAGCTERVGNMVSYNNRFHCYQSTLNHVIQVPTVSKTGVPDDDNEIHWMPYVKFKNGWKLVDAMYEIQTDKKNHFIYPLADVERLAFVKAIVANTTTVQYDEMFYVDLKDSSAYNYSFAFDVTPNIVPVGDFYDEIVKDKQVWSNSFEYDKSVLLEEEVNEINVSAPINPFVFPVKYSYSFGGEIKDITTAYTPVSSTQIGQFPITVFTTNGIFAMEQGSRDVLYSNTVPLLPQVIDGKATATPYGTFFTSSKNLYLLNGREAINVSYAQHGKIESGIRENNAYQALCCRDDYGFYNFSDALSKEEFEVFVSDAILVYDQFQNELYISSANPDIKYSYVFNLDTKAYFKVDKSYAKAQNGAKYVIEKSSGTGTIVDLHSEVDGVQPILLQSRPFSLEAFSTHIQRLKLLVDTKLEQGQNLCFSVFGSDNLYDWKCIISAQKQNTVLRHIRTNRAAKSYRDYVILISGLVSTDTDLSDIIADYTVVSRRFE